MPMRPEFTEVGLDEASQSRGLDWVLARTSSACAATWRSHILWPTANRGSNLLGPTDPDCCCRRASTPRTTLQARKKGG